MLELNLQHIAVLFAFWTSCELAYRLLPVAYLHVYHIQSNISAHFETGLGHFGNVKLATGNFFALTFNIHIMHIQYKGERTPLEEEGSRRRGRAIHWVNGQSFTQWGAPVSLFVPPLICVTPYHGNLTRVNWYSFYKNKFGFLGLACVLLWTLARLLAVAMFGISAPPLVRQGNAWGGD